MTTTTMTMTTRGPLDAMRTTMVSTKVAMAITMATTISVGPEKPLSAGYCLCLCLILMQSWLRFSHTSLRMIRLRLLPPLSYLLFLRISPSDRPNCFSIPPRSDMQTCACSGGEYICKPPISPPEKEARSSANNCYGL